MTDAGNIPFSLWDTLRDSPDPVLVNVAEMDIRAALGDLIAFSFLGVRGRRWFEVVEVGADYFVIMPTDKRPPKP